MGKGAVAIPVEASSKLCSHSTTSCQLGPYVSNITAFQNAILSAIPPFRKRFQRVRERETHTLPVLIHRLDEHIWKCATGPLQLRRRFLHKMPEITFGCQSGPHTRTCHHSSIPATWDVDSPVRGPQRFPIDSVDGIKSNSRVPAWALPAKPARASISHYHNAGDFLRILSRRPAGSTGWFLTASYGSLSA